MSELHITPPLHRMTTKEINMQAQKFRKKPVVIEAMQLTGSAAQYHAVYQWVERHTLGSFEPLAVIEGHEPYPASGVSIDPRDGRFIISTLEGLHWVDPGDWIIRGVAGEFYPVKDSIFRQTYEAVSPMTDPRPEWVEAGVAALVAVGCAESGSAFMRENVYVDGAVTVVLAAVIDQIKSEALGARWMTVASALAEDEDYPQILTDVLHAALPDVVRQAKAEAWDEGHYMSELNLRHAYDGHDCEEGEMCPTCCQPNPYRADRTEPLGENPVLTAMSEYAEAIRDDWSNFDGRSEKSIIDGWVRDLRQPNPSHDIEWHRRDLGICMAGGGHWCGHWGHCDDECGCVPCSEDRSSR